MPDTLTYLWSSNAGGVFADATQKDTTWTAPDVNGNTVVTLTLLVTDSGGLTDTDSVNVTVRAVAPVAQRPGTPDTPTVTSRTSSSITLSTTPGSGGAATGYRWRYSTNSTVSNSDPSATSTGPTVTITGLAEDDEYWVDVRAENSAGNSAYSSDRATSTAAAAAQPPGPPTNLQVGMRTTTTIALSVSPGSRGAPTGYRWRLSTNTFMSDSDTVKNTSGSLVTFTGLNVGTSYWVDVRAQNASGNSDYTPAGGAGLETATLDSPPTPGVASATIVFATVEIENTEVALTQSGAAGLIPSNFVEGNGSAYLRHLFLIFSGNNSGKIVLRTVPSLSTGNSSAAGPNLASNWESNPTALTFSAPGLTNLVVPGPMASGSIPQDTEEPYSWLPTNHSAVATWAASLTASHVVSVTLALAAASPSGAHAVNAGDVAWAFTVSQATITHVPAAAPDFLTYLWSSDSGGMFADATHKDTTWTAPDVSQETVVTLTLLVTDSGGLTDTDSVVVTVRAPAPGVAHTVNAGGVTWSFALPQPAISYNIIRLDSLNALDAVFRRQDRGNQNGAWKQDSGGSTGSTGTGPGTNSAGSYVHSESTSGVEPNIPLTSTLTALASVMSAWVGNGRVLALRACIQGNGTYPNDSASGLQIQGRATNRDSWATIELLEGWAYSNSLTPGDTVIDSLGVTKTIVQAGGWVDFEVVIPDAHRQLRIRNIPITDSTTATNYLHDAALWNMALRDGTTPAVDHAVDAGDVAWAFEVPQSSITHTPAPSLNHTVDAGDVAWAFTLPRPTITHTVTHTINAGNVSWAFAIPEPAVTRTSPDPINHTVNAGDIAWAFILPQPAVTHTSAPVPDQPTGLTATVTHDTVSLSWDDPNDSTITSYQILRRDITGGGSLGVHIDSVPAGTSYVDSTNVASSNRYSYRIKARNAQGLSSQSGYRNATTATAPINHAVNAGDVSWAFALPQPTVTYTPVAIPDFLTYLWSSNAGGVFADAALKDTTWTAPDVSQDTVVTLTLLVTDSGGLTDTDSVDVTVRAIIPAIDHTVNAGDIAWAFTLPQSAITHVPAMPAPAFAYAAGAITEGLRSLGGTTTIPIPPHRAGAQLIIMVGHTYSSSPVNSIPPPAGWTVLLQGEAGGVSAVGLAAWSKTGNGSESTVNIPAIPNISRNAITAIAIAVDPVASIESVSLVKQESGTDINSPSITPTGVATILRAFVFDDDTASSSDYATDSNFKGVALGYEEAVAPGNGFATGFSIQVNAAANVATGTSTWSSNGDSDAGLALTIALLQGAAGPVDHVVNAGNVSWAFTVLQPTIAHTTTHSVDAGNVVWAFALPRPTVTYTTPTPINHVVNAGDIAWAFALPEPIVTHTSPDPINHTVNSGDVSWSFALPQPTITNTSPDFLTYLWSSNAGGVFADATLKDTTWTTPDVSQETIVTLTLLVTDSGGLTDTDSVDVTVRLAATPIDHTVNAGAVSWAFALPEPAVAHVSPAAPDFLTYLWTSTAGGVFADATQKDTTWTAPDVSQETVVTLTLLVTDSGGLTDTDSVDITVRVATPTDAVDAGDVSWTFVIPQVAVTHVRTGVLAHAIDAGVVSWTFTVPQPIITQTTPLGPVLSTRGSVRITYSVFVDWDGDGIWKSSDNIAEDCQLIDLRYGRDTPSSISGRIRGGSCDIRLNNIQGKYTPFSKTSPYANQIIPGRRLQVQAHSRGTTYILWTGYLKDIIPHNIVNEAPYAQLTAVGPWLWLDQSRFDFFLTLNNFDQDIQGNSDQIFLTAGRVISELLDEIEWKGYQHASGSYVLNEPGPYGRRLDPGLSLIDLDAVLGEGSISGSVTNNIRAIKSMRAIEEAEPGFLWVDPEANFVFENRQARIQPRSTLLFSDVTTADLPYRILNMGSYLDNIYNIFHSTQAKYLWSNIQQVGTVIPGLFNSIVIGPGETLTRQFELVPEAISATGDTEGKGLGAGWAFVRPWRTPTTGPVGVSIDDNIYNISDDATYKADIAAGWSTADVHGEANDFVRILSRPGARSIRVSLTNTHPNRSLYIVKFRLRGYPAATQGRIRYYAFNAASVQLYQPREYPIPTSIIKSRDIATAPAPERLDHIKWADQLAAIYGSPRPQGTLVVNPRASAHMADVCLSRTISHGLAIRNVYHGLFDPADLNYGHPFFIENVRHTIKPGVSHRIEWGLSSSEHVTPFWRLGQGQLGLTTMLTY